MKGALLAQVDDANGLKRTSDEHVKELPQLQASNASEENPLLLVANKSN